jgi:hypothetical protein
MPLSMPRIRCCSVYHHYLPRISMPASARQLLIASFSALVFGAGLTAIAEDPKKDAAEAVGEGNASRWLDFYRRERGQQWESKPGNEAKDKPADPVAPQDDSRRDTQPAVDRR